MHQRARVLCVVSARDSRWSALRNIIVSIYQPSHLAGLIPSMQSHIERAATNLDDGGEAEVAFSKLALSLATDVIGQAAFGADFGLTTKPAAPPPHHGPPRQHGEEDGDGSHSTRSSEFIKMHIHSTTSLKMDLSGSLSTIVGTLLPVLQWPLRQLLLRVPGAADREIQRVNGALCRMMDGIVADRVAARERAPEAQRQKDFLSVVLAARDSDAAARKLLTPDYLSALTYEHLLAGSATTAFTLSSVLYLVAQHPRVEEKLLREVDAFGPPDRVPTAEDLQCRFPYTDQASTTARMHAIFFFGRDLFLTHYNLHMHMHVQVLKESMRFFMVSPLVARETSEQVDIAGYVLPKVQYSTDSSVLISRAPISNEMFPTCSCAEYVGVDGTGGSGKGPRQLP